MSKLLQPVLEQEHLHEVFEVAALAAALLPDVPPVVGAEIALDGNGLVVEIESPDLARARRGQSHALLVALLAHHEVAAAPPLPPHRRLFARTRQVGDARAELAKEVLQDAEFPPGGRLSELLDDFALVLAGRVQVALDDFVGVVSTLLQTVAKAQRPDKHVGAAPAEVEAVEAGVLEDVPDLALVRRSLGVAHGQPGGIGGIQPRRQVLHLGRVLPDGAQLVAAHRTAPRVAVLLGHAAEIVAKGGGEDAIPVAAVADEDGKGGALGLPPAPARRLDEPVLRAGQHLGQPVVDVALDFFKRRWLLQQPSLDERPGDVARNRVLGRGSGLHPLKVVMERRCQDDVLVASLAGEDAPGPAPDLVPHSVLCRRTHAGAGTHPSALAGIVGKRAEVAGLDGCRPDKLDDARVVEGAEGPLALCQLDLLEVLVEGGVVDVDLVALVADVEALDGRHRVPVASRDELPFGAGGKPMQELGLRCRWPRHQALAEGILRGRRRRGLARGRGVDAGGRRRRAFRRLGRVQWRRRVAARRFRRLGRRAAECGRGGESGRLRWPVRAKVFTRVGDV